MDSYRQSASLTHIQAPHLDSFRYAKTDSNQSTFIRRPILVFFDQVEDGSIDANGDYNIEFSLANKYHCDSTINSTVNLGFQVKCIVKGKETPWSPMVSASIHCTQQSSASVDQISSPHLNGEARIWVSRNRAYVDPVTDGIYTIRVYNAIGQLMQSDRAYMSTGVQQAMDMKELSSGFYIIRLTQPGKQPKSKVFVVE